MHLPQHTYLQLDQITSICQFVHVLINIPISFVSAVILVPIWLFYALNVWMFKFSLLEVDYDCFEQNEISKRKREFGMPWKVNFTKYIEIFHIKSTLMKERDLREGLQLNLRKNMKSRHYSYLLMWVEREDLVPGYLPYCGMDIVINWKGWLDSRAIYHIVVWILI